MTTLHLRKSIDRLALRGGLLLGALALVCALSQSVQAVSPTPDGGYPGDNTAEGNGALYNLTSGIENTAVGQSALGLNTTGNVNTAVGSGALQANGDGFQNAALGAFALYSNTTGISNTATGSHSLYSNTDASDNTAIGWNALQRSTTGAQNTATGVSALQNNTMGTSNTASGFQALMSNTTGVANTANGPQALLRNTTGQGNAAFGSSALVVNTIGNNNTAIGHGSLYSNTTGSNNIANGYSALQFNTTGSNNIAFGLQAGVNLTTSSNNIDISNAGVAGDAGKIRLGTTGTHTATFVAGIYNVSEGGTIKPVYINSTGRLGTQAPASARKFKEEIKAMEKTSEGILGLQPVTFRYKNDSEGTPQFGLIAEDVAKVNPDLVVRDENGEIYTVRYDAVNAMLLNEFLRARRQIDAQQKQIDALTAGLQKVSAQLETSKPAPQVVKNP